MVDPGGVAAPERVEAVERSGLLDSGAEEAFDRLTRLAALVVGAPTALVSIVGTERQYFKSAFGLSGELAAARQTSLTHSYCKHVVALDAPLVVEDARTHPLTAGNPAIEDHDAIAYCGVPVRDPDGHVLGSFCVVDERPVRWTQEQVQILTELSEMVMTELRLRRLASDLQGANAALVEANRTLRDFVSVASHDMKNPLTSVVGFSALMREKWESLPPESLREFIEIIERQARYLSRLVEDLLTISKLEAGAVGAIPERIDVATAIESVLRGSPHDTREHVRVSTGGAPAVLADDHHVSRIITNLVSNAFKYGEPPIFITTAEDDGSVSITVADSGAGVPEEFVPRLFNKFARAENEATRKQEGTGLGLSIVRGLAEANGGTIRYEPNEPSGSRFIVTLPKG